MVAFSETGGPMVFMLKLVISVFFHIETGCSNRFYLKPDRSNGSLHKNRWYKSLPSKNWWVQCFFSL